MFIEHLLTVSFTWSALMFLWMLVNMVPQIERWEWRGLIEDISVVMLVGIIAFVCSTVTLSRWLDFPDWVVATAIAVMAIVSTPIAIRVHNKARGR
jgi:putative effector of murein hydrolase